MSNPFFASYQTSDLFGKTIFISLFGLSLLSWYVIIYKVWLHRATRRLSRQFARQCYTQEYSPLLLEVATPPGFNPFFIIYQKMRSLCWQLLEKNRLHSTEGMSFLTASDMEFVGNQVENLVTQQAKRLERNLFLLSTTVTLAPFLGLLGTVWGSLETLSSLRYHHSLGGSSPVLEGLSMALATTVAGLLVAIPALVGYSYLRAATREFVLEMCDFASHLLTAIELQYRRTPR
jgi:biopolymer transport protein TolQ